MSGTPAKEIRIDAGLVRALLEEQHPDLADATIEELAEGWDNVIYRLGHDLTVRLPRRQASASLIHNEQRWLPELASELTLPVPVPIALGAPSAALGYPWSWSVGPWLSGVPAEHAPLHDLSEAARCLGRFVAALHRPAPSDAPINPYRGTPLGKRAERLLSGLDELGDADIASAVLARWQALVDTPPWPGPPVWLHGDLHPLNLLVDRGHLSAVIDFGDVCAGDPAVDLAIGWMLFPSAERRLLRSAAAVDDDTWRRAQGWALALSVAFAAGDGRISGIGHRTMAAVLADEC